MARRLRTHSLANITTNVLHPGIVASSFGSGAGGLMGLITQIGRSFMISAEKGAETSIFLASSPEVASTSGGYFDKKKAQPVKHGFNTPENARRLWELSEQLTRTKFLD